jgi:hypothetical protein
MKYPLKTIVVSEAAPDLPDNWHQDIVWLQPSTGKWFTWNDSSWSVSSAPLVVIPSEVSLDTELDARMLAHETLPNVHHPQEHSHPTHGDINFTGSVSAGGDAGITGSKTLGGFKITFKKGILTGFEAV